VRDEKGDNTGDPLNLVIIGRPLDVYTAFIRAGWDETETVTRASAWKTVKSFVSGGEYRYSPVSSLYVFGRAQDVAFQKARETIHERNHLRLWMSPVTYRGFPVWIGQISRDIGVRFTTKTITTHKIDPNVDDTREYLLENLAYAQSLRSFGYVEGVGEVPPDQPRGNLTGDPWFTDGYRLVLWVTDRPTALSELTFLPWRMPFESD
ncbi:MAG: LssY C-terminal domain-containing protein, partial [Planctomycetes bacterium]|nr:LssY C-terminal domain-containing protein [Planctomycetota bacterium]